MCHHLGCTSIHRTLSYLFNSLPFQNRVSCKIIDQRPSDRKNDKKGDEGELKGLLNTKELFLYFEVAVNGVFVVRRAATLAAVTAVVS